MNVKLLRRVKAQILKEPGQFVMAAFFAQKETLASSDIARKRIPRCGTAACIAGWAISLAAEEPPKNFFERPINSEEEARRVLDLDVLEGQVLFYAPSWPEKFYFAFLRANTMAARARIAAARINYFIRTGA